MVKKEKTANNGGTVSLDDAAKTLNDALSNEGNASSVLTAIDLAQYVVDTTAPAEQPAYQLEIDGVGIIPPGITAVCGRAKQGKTHLLNVIAATMLSGREFGTMRKRKPVGDILWIDTEQEKYIIQMNAKRLLRAAGLDEQTDSRTIGLTILTLRDVDVEKRQAITHQAIETYKPQVVIIDGVRDLLHDFNDVGESLDTLQLLMDATAASEDLALIAVLHMNEGTDKMRGHLGTELWNKCNTLLECSKENGVFTVQNKSRLKEAAPFRFCINDAGDYAPSDAVNAAGVINDADALALCFDGGDKECGVTFDELMRRYKKFACLSSLNQARSILKEKINGGLIRKDTTTRLFYLA